MKKYLIIILFFLISVFQIHAQGYSPTYFSKAEFKEDLQFLSQKVMHMHPKTLLPAESSRWLVMIDSIEKNLSDSISYNEAYIKVSNSLATLHDSHSDFSFSYTERAKYNENGGVTMPFTVRVVRDKLFINQYFGDNRSDKYFGAEILAINLISSDEILGKMRSLSASVTPYNVERYFGPYFWMFWGPQPEYRISVSRNDSIFSITTNGVTSPDFFALKNKYYPEKEQKKYELTFLDSNFTSILKIKQFADDLAPFLRNAFDTINHKKSKILIIDLRDNPGGTSYNVDSLLNYLINKPYTQYSSRVLRVSDEVKTYYQEKRPYIYKLIAQLPVDTIYKFYDNELISTPVAQRVFFGGNIFVLINHNTFSAATTFAGVIKFYKLGKIIGQPTGEAIRYYANYIKYKLPHLGEEFTVSPEEFVQHGGNVSEQGVIPDVLLKDESLSISEIVMEYCNIP